MCICSDTVRKKKTAESPGAESPEVEVVEEVVETTDKDSENSSKKTSEKTKRRGLKNKAGAGSKAKNTDPSKAKQTVAQQDEFDTFKQWQEWKKNYQIPKKRKAAAETEDVQEVFQLQGNGEVLQSKAMSVGGRAARAPFSRSGRPTSRAPPPLLLKRRPRSSRAPPSMMQCTAGHPPQQSNLSKPAQWRWTGNRSSSPKGPHQQTGEVRPGLVQCRAPPAEARTEGSESRLDHELRQSRGGGLPLPEKTRNQMESGIGADFNNVRVHTDASAEQMNRMLGSQAFATGNDIFFASGKYDPESLDGQRLLAHELTHTVRPRLAHFVHLEECSAQYGSLSTLFNFAVFQV